MRIFQTSETVFVGDEVDLTALAFSELPGAIDNGMTAERRGKLRAVDGDFFYCLPLQKSEPF